MHPIHASKTLVYLWFNFGPYEIPPFQSISWAPRCPANPAIGQLLGLRRARHQKKLQHIAEIATDSLSKPGSMGYHQPKRPCWWKETMGIGWDTVSIFNQCTGMLQRKPQPEREDHWHLSSLKSMASSHWTREVGWHNSHSSSCHASRHDISQAQGVAVDAFQCQEASMKSWSAANWKRGPKTEMAWNGHD